MGCCSTGRDVNVVVVIAGISWIYYIYYGMTSDVELPQLRSMSESGVFPAEGNPRLDRARFQGVLDVVVGDGDGDGVERPDEREGDVRRAILILPRRQNKKQ
jgi:hypothetical protein